jgi:methylmalonyl-CoA mutase
MSAPTDPLPLAAEFPATTRAQWVEAVTGVLRRAGLPEGADPVAALSSTTYDGISVLPLYTAADLPASD